MNEHYEKAKELADKGADIAKNFYPEDFEASSLMKDATLMENTLMNQIIDNKAKKLS